jgi:predicted mannosyl-3-phosphoglycerate phosphatase (HAD superfamily)
VAEGDLVVLGVPRARVLDALAELRDTEAIAFRGYADLTLEEVRNRTGLAAAAAGRARRRDFSETVWVEGGPAAWARFVAALPARGLRTFGDGPSGTVVGSDADKGRALVVLDRLYRAWADASGRPVPLTAGVGDAANDAPMLRGVGRAFLVERPGGGWAQLDVEGLERVEGVGPVGWARAAARLSD